MVSVFVKDAIRKKSLYFSTESNSMKSLYDQMACILHSEEFYVVCNGRIADSTDQLYHDYTYHIVPRLVGGKGGFGSMLRALGAQIEKTTNREACRDLSGRRMRDVNNEKQVKEWVEKKAEREQEKEQRREERRQKRLQFLEGNKHKFDDLQYQQQKQQVSEQLDDALQQGLSKLGTSNDEIRKRRHAEESTSSAKKSCEWLGIENLSDLESSSSESSEDDYPVPGPSCMADKSDHAESANFDSCSDSGVESIGQLKQDVQDMVDSPDSNKSCTNESSNDATLEKSVVKQQSDNHEMEKEKEIDNPGLLALLPSPCNLAKPEPMDVNLEEYESQKDLENLGLDILKSALMARGLKCGGTLEQRAERLWIVKGKSAGDIDPSLFAKPSKGKGKGKKKGQ